jgi:hypothetical protein
VGQKFSKNVSFSVSFGGFDLIGVGLVVAPGDLSGEGGLDVFEFGLVGFEGFLELDEEFFSALDEVGESLLLVGE